jgi:hypothetical protein
MAARGKAVSSYYQNQMNVLKKMDVDSVIEDEANYRNDMEENSPVVFNIQKMNNIHTMSPSKFPGLKSPEKQMDLNKENPTQKKVEGKTKADLARRNLMKLS